MSNKPVIEVRSADDELSDPPLFSGNEDDVNMLRLERANDWDELGVWFHITNGDGSKENITLAAWDEAFGN